uniref:Saposin B-type domain-containing protein n=1 Tax=Strongyloides papillosus TaxID=174720 RepID=A0A0N5BR01_STREA
MSADTSTLYYRCQNCLSLENKDRSDENCNLKTGATAQIKISSFIKNKDHIDKCKSIPLIDAIVKHANQYFLKESESFVGVPIDEYDRFIYKIIAICRKLEIPAIGFFKNRK